MNRADASTWQRLGFDTARLGFTMRTAVAVCCAVVLAWLLGLAHPQWAGMTVWAASQPLRGQLLEKSLFRMLGTVLGAVVGMALLILSNGQEWVVVLGLAVWIGLCAGAGNLIRSFASYGAMLAGYSAAMVALLHSPHAGDPVAVGLDRMLTVLLGVLVALAVGWLFAARGDYQSLQQRTRKQVREVLVLLTERLAAGRLPERERSLRLLAEMAAVEEALDAQGAGSRRGRMAARVQRRRLAALVAILLWLRRSGPGLSDIATAEALGEALATLDEPDGRTSIALRQAASLARDPLLAGALSSLARALLPRGGAGMAARAQAAARDGMAWHRDWRGAREAATRASLVMLVAGAVWQVADWEAGPFMMLGAAIMTTIFSTADAPVRMLRQVLVGQALGVGMALVWRWLIWPWLPGEFALLLSMMVGVLLCGLFFAHQRGAGPKGFDLNMVFLLMLQPAWPLTGDLGHSLQASLAVVLGPALGLLAFSTVFPVDGTRRLRALAAAMVQELESMAGRRGVARQRTEWRTRLCHRLLGLVRWADKTGLGREQAAEAGYAGLLLGAVILHMDEVLAKPGVGLVVERRLELLRARLQRLSVAPVHAALALDRAATALAGQPGVDVGLLRDAAAALMAWRAGGEAGGAWLRDAGEQVGLRPQHAARPT